MTKYRNYLNLENKKAFVVGGLGLIGQEVSFALAENQAKVIIIDNDLKKYKKNKKYNRNIQYEKLDLKKKNAYKVYNKIISNGLKIWDNYFSYVDYKSVIVIITMI